MLNIISYHFSNYLTNSNDVFKLRFVNSNFTRILFWLLDYLGSNIHLSSYTQIHSETMSLRSKQGSMQKHM